MRFLFNPVTNQLNAAPPRDTIYAATAPVNPPFGTRWANTQTLREYLYIDGQWVEVGVGPAGKQGDKGDAATVSVTSTAVTGAAGSNVLVENTGTTSAAVLKFTVPKGDTGTAATVAVGTTTTGAAGTNAAVSNSGTTSAAVLNFTVPQGVKGDAATIAVGTTTTGAAGTNAAVSNSGTTSAAVLNFTVPKGDTGTAATVAVGTTTTGAAGTSAAVTNSGTTSAAVLNFTVPQGIQGAAGRDGTSVVLKGAVATFSALPTANRTQGDLWVVSDTGDGYVWSGTVWENTGKIRGPQGPQATISVGQTVTGAAGTSALVENTGTASAAVLKFTIPQGAKGDKGDKGDTGGQGPAGPAPSGTGAVVVNNGLLATPVAYGSTNTVSTLVQRDASGNFSASTITASLSGSSTSCTGNAASATKLATTRAINVSGDVTGTAQNFDGSAAITIPTAISAGVIVNADINATAAIADTKLATISTAGKVLNSATTAASANTASAIVARDALGNFSAGTITASLTGNASTATKFTTARKINTVSFDGSADITISAAPTSHTHPYSQITDTPYKDGVTVATTVALLANYTNGTSGVGATLTYASSYSDSLNTLVIDGLTVSVGTRVLIKDQTTSAQNGIYTLTTAGSASAPWVLTRGTDADSSSELGGAVVSVDRGTSNGGKLFSTSFSTASTVGSSSCQWFTVIDSAGGTFTGNLTIENTTPQIKFVETDNFPYWLLASGGSFYVTTDRDNSGAWETPHPLQLRGSDGLARVFGNDIWHSGNLTPAKDWVSKTAAYTAVAGDRISADTRVASFTLTLPASPAAFTEIVFADHYNQWATRNLTIARNGQNIEGLAEDLVCNVAGKQFTMRYEGTTWRVYL
jgi:hypothetical protein